MLDAVCRLSDWLHQYSINQRLNSQKRSWFSQKVSSDWWGQCEAHCLENEKTCAPPHTHPHTDQWSCRCSCRCAVLTSSPGNSNWLNSPTFFGWKDLPPRCDHQSPSDAHLTPLPTKNNHILWVQSQPFVLMSNFRWISLISIISPASLALFRPHRSYLNSKIACLPPPLAVRRMYPPVSPLWACLSVKADCWPSSPPPPHICVGGAENGGETNISALICWCFSPSDCFCLFSQFSQPARLIVQKPLIRDVMTFHDLSLGDT